MTQFQFFAIEPDGPRPLPIPPGAAGFVDLYRGLPLGVYTALRTFEHDRFLYLDRHLARTTRSMALLGWDYALDEARLRRALHTVVSAAPFREMRVRIDVLVAPAPAVASAGAGATAARELIALQPFVPPPPELYARGVAVDYAAMAARDNPLVKAAEYAAQRPASSGLTQLEGGAALAAPYEHLLLDDRGRILEGSSSNFWAVRDGVIHTAGAGVLEGITRAIILQIITDLELPLSLEPLPAAAVASFDEAAISGSSRAIVPVVAIAGRTIGDGRPGPLTRRLLAAYNEFVAAHIEPAICE